MKIIHNCNENVYTEKNFYSYTYKEGLDWLIAARNVMQCFYWLS